MALFSKNAVWAWAHLFAMLWGYLFLKSPWASIIKQVGKKRAPKRQNKGHLRLVDEDDDQDQRPGNDPKYWQ